jgi:hypothetical protein
MAAGDDDFIRRAARAATKPQPGNLTVSAPLNDVQMLSMVAAALYGKTARGEVLHAASSEEDTGAAASEAVSAAVQIVARAAVAVKAGDLIRVMQVLIEERTAAPAGPSLVGH